ncbi:MAG: hypothetical protein HY820_19180 [Acidobacteria bacterium]|nr:hypothetical protein [Acidobacteriota bacterium]
MRMCLGFAVVMSMPLAGEEWDRAKAFQYMEGRQQEWADWKPAQKPGGPCISCHTGLAYLLARRATGEQQPRPLEKQLVEGVQTRLLEHEPLTMFKNAGVESILNLLALSVQRRDKDAPLSKADEIAMKRLWETQLREGEESGAWTWFVLELHPFESEHSVFYGAALAEKALAAYPNNQLAGVEALRGYLRKEAAKQPLHNRLAWIAFSPSAGKSAKAAVLRDLWRVQAGDGGWTSASLGPWAKREKAPPDTGSNGYATAWAAYAARQAGAKCEEPGMKRALRWLRSNQDAASGAWKSVSLNKVYPEGSMQRGFMTDAATGYAAAALLGCE